VLEKVCDPDLESQAGLPSALLQDGPGTPTQVNLAEKVQDKVERAGSGRADKSERSGAGSKMCRRDGLKLAKPVGEIKADEDADGHIEEMRSMYGFKGIDQCLFILPQSEDNGSNKELQKIRFQMQIRGLRTKPDLAFTCLLTLR
jgi:hypothetical protein